MPNLLAVIGGGVIGLSVARRAAQAGWSVRVHRTGEHGASWVAGACWPRTAKAGRARKRLLRLGLESLRLWHEGGYLDGPLPPHVITARESLVVAVDAADVADLRTVADWLSAQGHPVIWESAARDVEPLLAQGIRHGFRAPTELAVDNRAVLDALCLTASVSGFQWGRAGHRPVRCRGRRGGDRQRDRRARAVAGPAGAAGQGRGAAPALAQGLYAVPHKVIRARVHGRQVTLVPRADGVVVGATQYEHGRDTAPVVSGVRDLLDDACAVLPALGEYELANARPDCAR